MSADIAQELFPFLWEIFDLSHCGFVFVREGRDSLRQSPSKGVGRELRGFRYGATVDAVYTEAVPFHSCQRRLTPNSMWIPGVSVIVGMIWAIYSHSVPHSTHSRSSPRAGSDC